MENQYNHKNRCFEHPLRFNRRAIYPKTFLDRLAFCVTINNNASVISHTKKDENVAKRQHSAEMGQKSFQHYHESSMLTLIGYVAPSPTQFVF
jgi:hypothetical protein